MNRKLKLALAALLGFSAACSSVKNAPRERSQTKQETDDSSRPNRKGDNPRIVVMYGVRTPEGQIKVTPLKVDSLQKPKPQSQPSELDPVAEKAED